MAPPIPGPLTRADALAVLRARMSASDLRMLLAQPDGAAMVESTIAVFVEQSVRLDRTITARHLLPRDSDVSPPAAGASSVQVTVSIARATSAVGRPRTFGAGQFVQTPEGHMYGLDADLPFAAGESGPKSVGATAIVAGAASTCLAGSIDTFTPRAGMAAGDLATVLIAAGVTYLVLGAGDLFTHELLGLYVRFTAGTNVGRDARILSVSDDGTRATLESWDLVAEAATATWEAVDWPTLGFAVTQPADSTVGTDDELDSLGRELGRQRHADETDAAYAEALLSLIERITPVALVAACNRIAGPLGPVELYEYRTGDGDRDPVVNSRPWPGFIADLTPCDLRPDLVREGLACLAPEGAFFMIGWDGGDLTPAVGGAAGADGTPPPPLLGRPVTLCADLSPCDGASTPADALRGEMARQLDVVRAGGVRWAFLPPKFT